MSAGWVVVPVAASVVLVVTVLVMMGSGDRTPTDPGCLPDLPRVNRTDPVASGAVVVPLPQGSYTVSSPFGPRAGGFHRGVDLAAPQGTPILAATEGVVVAAGPAQGFGNWIVLDTQRPDGVTSTVYGHMFADGVLVHVGDQVRARQQIGKVGAAGEATGAHLHFEVWPGGRLHSGGHAIDPLSWLANSATAGAQSTIEPAAVVSSRTARRRNALASSGCDPTPVANVSADGSLRAGSVPPEYDPWIRKSATQCPELSAPILAAELKQESGFNRWARSPAGALGPAQFMPGTWAMHGISAEGNGPPDPFSIPDAVMSQGKYACELISIMKHALADGRVHGDLTQLWLSAYNCGAANTLAQGGVCQNSETLAYVRNIPAMAAAFTAAGPQPDIRAESGGTR
ncbi:M23 family metallopeptidase [Nocardia macrotermitis]|uniref:Uncharacterized protein n=1 Tax=Nocardia macrotermitis TaxID=2585198 RepID=A0A7K0CZS8_9NOCA|nr:M23 family metallopeptidase [Nocardia macrotermitis]MQY18950.1 hypothetical protein [Nocardia macrotermitis]